VGFPLLPYPLPPGFVVSPSKILTLPEEDQCCHTCVMAWLDCLLTQPVLWEGFNWVIQVNYKVYFLKWRDVSPRPPWTEQVWDIYQILPDVCGCPSAPRGLGWQWCWEYVLKTIKSDVLRNWVNTFSGPGGVVVADGTNTFVPGTVGLAQVGPVIRYDAADSSTITEVAGLVSRWADKSTFNNHAIQDGVGVQPTLVPGFLNGLPVIRFNGSTWMDIRLKAVSDYHLFVVGRFNTNLVYPRGTFLAATGLDGTFGGLEGKVYQDGSLAPVGTPFVYLHPTDRAMVGTQGTAGQFHIWEYSETISESGSIRLSLDAFGQTIFSGNTAEDFWDPTRQMFGGPAPVLAALGRSNWGVNPGRNFDYLDGDIGEILLYPRTLAEGQRIQVLNVLRAKWGLGAVLP